MPSASIASQHQLAYAAVFHRPRQAGRGGLSAAAPRRDEGAMPAKRDADRRRADDAAVRPQRDCCRARTAQRQLRGLQDRMGAAAAGRRRGATRRHALATEGGQEGLWTRMRCRGSFRRVQLEIQYGRFGNTPSDSGATLTAADAAAALAAATMEIGIIGAILVILLILGFVGVSCMPRKASARLAGLWRCRHASSAPVWR